MSAAFPFVDPFTRLENALWSVFHCRGNKSLAVVLTSLWEMWSLQPTLHRRIVASRSALLKVVVVRILRAVNLRISLTWSLPIDQLHTLLQLLHVIVSGSILLQQFTTQIQRRFSEFTSGWKLCIDLCKILSRNSTVCQEFAIDGLDFGTQQDQIGVADDGVCSIISMKTSRSVASTKYSVVPSTAQSELKQAHYQSAITKDDIQEHNPNEHFRLKTLEEYRFATRFQEKRVTLKTWRWALREAHKFIQSGDRVSLAEALYLLLEIIYLDPRGCNLASMYLDTGSIYLAFDHLDEAAKAYRNSLRLDGSNWRARYNLGVAAARLQHFADATRQLRLASKSCPPDIASEIATILVEIEHIQYSKNLRAFHETAEPRTFTMQYLESQYLVSGTRDSSALQEECTLSHRKGVALISSTPLLLDVSHEWQGALASLLHRLHAVARCRHCSVQDEMLQLDSTRTGRVTVGVFNEVVARITGIPLRITEQQELTRMLGKHGSTSFLYLKPNTESCHAFDEIQHHGACHTRLNWNLYRKRTRRSVNSKTGGLWYWFEMTMTQWIKQVLPQPHPVLVETLFEHGWLTPLDFAWRWRHLPEPDTFPMLQLADRGIFIYECHRTRRCIQEEASKVLQMFVRRFLIKCKWSKHVGAPHIRQEISVHETAYLEDLHTRLVNNTLFDQQVALEVLQCIDDMVYDVICFDRRQQQKIYEDLQLQEIPMRTEQRQQLISGAVQTNEATQNPHVTHLFGHEL